MKTGFGLCLKRSIIILCSLFYCFVSNAYDFEVDGIYYNIQSIENRTCVVTSPKLNTLGRAASNSGSYTIRRPDPNLYSGKVIIPQNPEYKGRQLTVVGIEDYAFYMCSDLLSVSLPPTVVTIGEQAFYGCKNLVSIEGVVNATIGIGAFAGCKSLKSIRLGKCPSISPQAFDGCTSLDRIQIPPTVKSIGEEAFANCGQISKVEFENGSSTLSIKKSAFKGSPIIDLFIGRNLTYWASYSTVFYPPFEGIVNLSIGDDVTSFYKDVKTGSSRDNGRYRDSRTGEIVHSDDIIRGLCESFKSVYDIEGLRTIVLGKAVTRIPNFENAKLERITIHSSTPPIVDGTFSFYSIINAVLIVPNGAINAYKQISPWKDFDIQGLQE